MSRIGKSPITIPAGVEVTYQDSVVSVKWPKGSLSYTHLDAVGVNIEDNVITVELLDPSKKNMWGLTRTLIANMIEGVDKWFEKKLHVIGVGYNVKAQWSKLTLNLGYSHPIEYTLPETVAAAVDKDPKWNDIVTLTSPNKQLVGEVAAKIKAMRKPEPYKWKGVRYFGERIKMKAGKTAVKK